MEFIIDTVNLEEIKDAIDHMPIVGVTSNPSIVKATAPENFFDHMRKVRDIIGNKAIKILKAEGINVTATAVYDLMQAYMALAAGADYIAPYVNRIGNLGSDPFELINELSNRIVMDDYDCKILAASFKGVQQVRDSFNSGAQAITAPVSVLKAIFNNPNIEKAVDDFNQDWYSVYGENKGICDL